MMGQRGGDVTGLCVCQVNGEMMMVARRRGGVEVLRRPWRAHG